LLTPELGSAASFSAPPSEPLADVVWLALNPNSAAILPIPDEYTLATIDPMIATPRAPPIWRVVSLTAEPTPALARGSEPITLSVAGAITRPMPAARMHMNPITS
jgi:hypothetical protein